MVISLSTSDQLSLVLLSLLVVPCHKHKSPLSSLPLPTPDVASETTALQRYDRINSTSSVVRVDRYNALLRPSLAVALVDFYGALNTTGRSNTAWHDMTFWHNNLELQSSTTFSLAF